MIQIVACDFMLILLSGLRTTMTTLIDRGVEGAEAGSHTFKRGFLLTYEVIPPIFNKQNSVYSMGKRKLQFL